jgi:Leucine-rich repeat (LRR) protein
MWKICAVLLLSAELGQGTLSDLECPEDCDCHYFRINWVTDCSESNLTEIPHEGLSQNVYILNMNGNNVTDVQPFPEDIKLRRLQLADNLLTELNKRSFAGLAYLLDADFSGNQITRVDPDAFRLVLTTTSLSVTIDSFCIRKWTS